MKSSPFAACSAEASRLLRVVTSLAEAAQALELPPLAGREWFEQLSRKLVPQLADDPFLVAAVVGGTNIGKSVIFNHLAGYRTSATSPFASGTKHPVCLVPAGFAERHRLDGIFQGFELHPWSDSEAALAAHETHRLFWRVSDQLPHNLLVLDTPDIDSDAPVNWHRADCIRHCADVLIAVLTQQKYNDAAVKQFFRAAAAEDKAVVVVFNQCLLPDDEAYWPLWLNTFARETGLQPDLVYVAPNNRGAAEDNRLPFFRRHWEGEAPAEPRETTPADDQPCDLGRDLAELHFADVKFRTLRGSLRSLFSDEVGLPSYLQEVRQRSAAYRSAADVLNSQQLARIDNWPTPPSHLLVDQVRQWWRGQRQGFSRSIHEFYNSLGHGLLKPVQWVRARWSGPASPPWDVYRQQEWDVILRAAEGLYDELARLAQLGNDLLKPRLERLLAGASRSEFFASLTQAHAAVDFAAELQAIVTRQMQSFQDESPQWYTFLKRVDDCAAVARPVTSVALFVAAAGPAGHALMPFVSQAAAQSLVIHVIGDIAGGAGAVVAGEAAMASGAGGFRYLEAKFQQLQDSFTAQRVAWFAEFLKSRLLGDLQTGLEAAANVTLSDDFRETEVSLDALRRQVAELTSTEYSVPSTE
ncbi:MAG: 50S ribosome-binding GTPase [Planctomycetales bacterium]|nr:50S ribosome-binding GTPase [Planctomycetales bacterium]